VNWAGFYVLDPSKPSQLILGPFHGKVACQTIAFGRGVCGAAASTMETQYVYPLLFPMLLPLCFPDFHENERKTQYKKWGEYGTDARFLRLVPDVDLFPGHIACDGDSKSEIVVPIRVPANGNDGEQKTKLVGIIDIDCAVKGGFDEVDRKYLEKLAELLGKACDW
jgi:L-methionine (R)-S-oxide reductase